MLQSISLVQVDGTFKERKMKEKLETKSSEVLLKSIKKGSGLPIFLKIRKT